MSTLELNNEAQKKLLLMELLASRTKDTIADISTAINRTFLSPDIINEYKERNFQQEINIKKVKNNIGHIFLTSAAGARRGNLTESFLFGKEKPQDSALIIKENNNNNNNNKEEDRWIRGIIIASPTLLPPPESIFLNRRSNGKILFDNYLFSSISLVLLLRVVGVSLPPFIALHGEDDENNNNNNNNNDIMIREKNRLLLQETEGRFLQGLEAFLLWMLRRRRSEKVRRFTNSRYSHNNNNNNNNNKSPSSFFIEEPATLSVPVYYFPLHIEDNSSSRITDVVNVSSDFIDLIADKDKSVVKETTALLQEIVQLSNFIEGKHTENNNNNNNNNNNESIEQYFDESLYKLHRKVTKLLEVVKPSSQHNRLVKNDNKTRGLGVVNAKILEMDQANYVHLSDIMLDDAPIDLFSKSNIYKSDTNNSSSSSSSSVRSSSINVNNIIDAIEENTLNPYPLPGVLVHCMKGVSRSPCIIMSYFMQKYLNEFYILSRIRRIQTDTKTNNNKSEDDYIFSFPKLLKCLREVRPVVNPQMCFIVELRSMWNRLSKKLSNKKAEELL